jgi:hypothetical protein
MFVFGRLVVHVVDHASIITSPPPKVQMLLPNSKRSEGLNKNSGVIDQVTTEGGVVNGIWLVVRTLQLKYTIVFLFLSYTINLERDTEYLDTYFLF